MSGRLQAAERPAGRSDTVFHQRGGATWPAAVAALFCMKPRAVIGRCTQVRQVGVRREDPGRTKGRPGGGREGALWLDGGQGHVGCLFAHRKAVTPQRYAPLHALSSRPIRREHAKCELDACAYVWAEREHAYARFAACPVISTSYAA